jgi:general secretion pathway protein C
MRSMASSTISRWAPRLAASLLAGLAAAGVVYWGLKVPAPGAGSAVAAVQVPVLAPDTGLVARALGGAAVPADVPSAVAAPVAASARFALLGVVDQAGRGVALIGLDGKPAKPVALGGSVGEGWVLRQVQGRSVTLERDGDAPLRLELPPRNKG